METTGRLPMMANPVAKNVLLIISCIMLVIGGCGGPLVTRLYFLHGGNHLWLASGIQTAGFPLIVIVLIILYFHRRATRKNDINKTKTTCIYMQRRLFFAAVFLGIIVGADGYLYSYGYARLPVSTASLIIASQLCFMAFFAFLIVKQKYTPYSLNAVVLLTIGSAVLALGTSSDRPEGESKKEYMMGFVITVAAALLVGLYFPLIELAYNKAKQTITLTLLLEFQVVLCLSASIVCTIGMIVNNDFKAIPKEATDFGLGKTKYYTILCASVLIWQCSILGTIGIIYFASSLLSGIISAVLLPLTEVLAIIFFKEKFQVEKGIALVLSIWGLASYFYGEYMILKKSEDETKSSPQSESVALTNKVSV